MRNSRSLTLGVALAVAWVAFFISRPAVVGQDDGAQQALLYELRTYTTAPGRLPALHGRFREHTMELFEKHGIQNVAYWTPVEKENTLVYVIAHKNAEAAQKSWDAFRDDPEWQKVFKQSRQDGPIVTKVQRQFLAPTDYSPMK